MTGKGALRRQMLPRRNASSNDIISNLLVNILIERRFAALFQIVSSMSLSSDLIESFNLVLVWPCYYLEN